MDILAHSCDLPIVEEDLLELGESKISIRDCLKRFAHTFGDESLERNASQYSKFTMLCDAVS